MASVVWRSSGGQAQAAVTVGDMAYTFVDGVPTDVLPEHLSTVQTKLTALGAVTTSDLAGQAEI